jgi:hypothetical protein
MKIKTIIEFEPDDLARPHLVETVVNLLGIRHLDDVPAPSRRDPDAVKVHPDRRVFNLIRNGGATFDDIKEASEIVTRRAALLREQAETQKPFCEERVNRDYADGLRSTANLAEREWATFMECLEDDLAAARCRLMST